MNRFVLIILGMIIGLNTHAPISTAQPSDGSTNQQAKKPPVPLDMQIRPTSIRPRTNAPIHTEVDIQWHGRKLLEGHFKFGVYDENYLIYTYSMPDIAIPAQGNLKRTITFPPVSTTNDPLGQLTIRPIFEGKPQNYTLKPIPINVTQYGRRIFTVLIAQPLPGINNSPEFKRYMNALRIESHAPREHLQKIVTQFANLKTDDLPRNPLNYLSYDMVVLADSGFQNTPISAFNPIAHWVESGGAIVIAPYQKSTSEQVEFLNRLAKSAGQSYFFTLGSDSELIINNLENDPQLLQLSPGLGRAVILLKHRERPDFFELSHWMRAKLFLWDIRQSQVNRIFNTGKWHYQQRQNSIPDMRASDSNTASIMAEMLRPPEIRLMPFSIIVMILVVFVVVIGPVDYFFLGFIRKRKFTWILFPLMSVLFTVIMVKSAEYYTGTEDHLRQLHIIDYGMDNQAHRHTRYDYRFVGSPKEFTLPVKQALLSIIDKDSIVPQNRHRPFENSGTTIKSVSGLPITGNFPTHYQVTHEVAQWTPQLYRYYLSTPELPENVPQWEQTTYNDWRVFSNIGNAGEKLYPALSGNVKVSVITSNQMHQWNSRTRSRKHISGENRNYRNRFRDYLSDRERTLAYSLSVKKAEGLFYVFGTVSPSGAASAEDLVIYDNTDDSSLLVVVEQQIGNKFYIHRKVFHR